MPALALTALLLTTPAGATPVAPAETIAAERTDEDKTNDVLVPAYFETGKARLTDEAQAVLHRNLDILQANPAVTVGIIGHADERGSEARNRRLAKKRARSVRRWMVRNGLPKWRVSEVVSRGEQAPAVADADHGFEYQLNRRVSFRVTTNLLDADVVGTTR